MDGFRPDTYGEAFADVYAQWYGSITDAEATAAFVDTRSVEGPILELGVGDGRLALPLADRGRIVVGVDASRSMLDQLATRDEAATRASTTGRVIALMADLARLPVVGPIGGALCAFNTLFNLPSADQQQGLFDRLASALAPGAPIVVEAITGHGLAESLDQSVGISQMSVDRLVLSATRVDAAAQTIEGQHVDITEHGIRLRPWQLRWTTPEQLDAMAKRAGLRLDERIADWHGEPFDDESDRHISVYRR
ncbi:MAG: class I SAM-dependent methyltransferase [Acidimicrobiales bacterium]